MQYLVDFFDGAGTPIMNLDKMITPREAGFVGQAFIYRERWRGPWRWKSLDGGCEVLEVLEILGRLREGSIS
jgi:hypothetical protein